MTEVLISFSIDKELKASNYLSLMTNLRSLWYSGSELKEVFADVQKQCELINKVGTLWCIHSTVTCNRSVSMTRVKKTGQKNWSQVIQIIEIISNTMQRVSLVFVLAAIVAIASADWLVNIDGCEKTDEFYSLFASNGNCFRQGKTFKKYQCSGSNYNILVCTDSSCSTCKIEKTLPQSTCVANKAMICSTSEPDYSKYAGNNYWVQKFYSTADCSGQISYSSVRGLDTCRSFVGTLYPSYTATCSANTVTYVDYNVQTLTCTPNPNIPPQTFTYPTNTCQQKSISTCVGN